VVDEPVDQGGGDHRVAEDLAPLLEAAVARDDDRVAFVAAGDEREEQVGGLAFERQVADLVDDQQVVALQPAQLGLELVAVLRRLQARDPLLRGGESNAVAALAGFEAERDRDVRLAGAGRAEEARSEWPPSQRRIRPIAARFSTGCRACGPTQASRTESSMSTEQSLERSRPSESTISLR
jgi:hypothetical protein